LCALAQPSHVTNVGFSGLRPYLILSSTILRALLVHRKRGGIARSQPRTETFSGASTALPLLVGPALPKPHEDRLKAERPSRQWVAGMGLVLPIRCVCGTCSQVVSSIEIPLHRPGGNLPTRYEKERVEPGIPVLSA